MAEEESFKVTDRRGRAREADRAEPEPLSGAESRASVAGVPVAAPAARPGQSAEPEGGRADLEELFVMFGSSAMINLGEAADPVTGERRVDLDQARDAIDVLLLLRDKTSGNRTEQESRFLEKILYDLQMRFVRATEAERSR